MTERVLAGAGTFTEAAWFGGLWWAVWQDGAVLRVLTFSPELLIQGPTQIIAVGPDAGAFPKLYAHADDLWLACRRGAPDFHIILRNLTRGTSQDVGVGHGNDPVVLGAGGIAWQNAGAPDYPVSIQPLDNSAPPRVIRHGAPTGLSRILPDGSVRTIDEDRNAIPGYTRPCWAGHAVAVEGAGLYDLVIRDDGKQARCFDGQDSQTPRLAWDGGERYLIGTWGTDGVRIALLENSDFIAPVPDPVPVPSNPMPAQWQTAEGAVIPDLLPRFFRGCTAVNAPVVWTWKSDTTPDWGAWLDFDAKFIGLLADNSNGETMPDGSPRSYYLDGPHVWLPRALVSGWRTTYQTVLRYADGTRRAVTISRTADVGLAVCDGVEFDQRDTYDPRDVDPQNPHRRAGFFEVNYSNDNGVGRWEEWQDDANGVPVFKRAAQPLPRLNGPFVAPPVPQPYPPIAGIPPAPPKVTMTAQELANVLKGFPQDVFLDHYRAYSAQLLDRDRAGAEGISDGAVMLFFPAFYGTAADLLVQRGIPTGAPADVAAKWNSIADAAGAAAVDTYRRATGNPQ